MIGEIDIPKWRSSYRLQNNCGILNYFYSGKYFSIRPHIWMLFLCKKMKIILPLASKSDTPHKPQPAEPPKNKKKRES